MLLCYKSLSLFLLHLLGNLIKKWLRTDSLFQQEVLSLGEF